MDKEKIKEIIDSPEFKSAAKFENYKECLTDSESMFYGTMLFFAGLFIYFLYFIHTIDSPLAILVDGLLIYWLLGSYLGRLIKIIVKKYKK